MLASVASRGLVLQLCVLVLGHWRGAGVAAERAALRVLGSRFFVTLPSSKLWQATLSCLLTALQQLLSSYTYEPGLSPWVPSPWYDTR